MHIALAAVPAMRNQQLLSVLGQVADEFFGGDIGDRGAHRHADQGVFASLAEHLPAPAVLATLRLEAALVAEVDQGVDVLIGNQPDAAAIAAVATIRSTERNKFLATKAHAAVATGAGLDVDLRFVDEFHWRAGNRKWGMGNQERQKASQRSTWYGNAFTLYRFPIPHSRLRKRKAPPRRGVLEEPSGATTRRRPR